MANLSSLPARIGEHEITATVRLEPGVVTMVELLFDRDRFPESPMGSTCFRAGSPEQLAWDGDSVPP